MKETTLVATLVVVPASTGNAMKLFCALILSALAGSALADVYKCVETDAASGEAHVT